MKQRIFALVLALLLMFPVIAGCSQTGGDTPESSSGTADSVTQSPAGGSDTTEPSGTAETTVPIEQTDTEKTDEPTADPDDKHYYITYYQGIPAENQSLERYREAVDAGFNLLSIDSGSVEQRQQALRWCEELGVRAAVRDDRLIDILYNDWETRLENPEALDAVVRTVVDDFRDYPALYAYDLIDEPEDGKFPLLGALVELFRKYDPDRICYINIFPDYPDPSDEPGYYERYLEHYLETVKPDLLSYDHYHLKWTARKSELTDITDPADVGAYTAGLTKKDNIGFFFNLEDVRHSALGHGVPYMVIVQLSEWGKSRYLVREEISFLAWQTLAYGCTVLSYFTYWTPSAGFYNAMLTMSGERTAHYYDVQAINAAITPIGERIAQTKSAAVYHVGYEDEREYVWFFPEKGYGAVRSVSGGEYTVGFFEDGTFIIANKDYEEPSRCTVEADAPLELFDVETETFVPVTENVFDLPAGGGVYLRVAEQ